MQEQEASKAPSRVARLGLWNIFWMVVCAALLLVAALAWLWPYHTLHTSTWREANSTLPWVGPGLTVKEVKGHWESSQGNERMMLRAVYYPVAEIELGQFQGSGMLYVSFTDGGGHQVGDTISLSYADGAFRPRTDVNIHTEGGKARVFIETGYENRSDFDLHMLDEYSPLWRVLIHHRPEGQYDVFPVGYVTIPAAVAS